MSRQVTESLEYFIGWREAREVVPPKMLFYFHSNTETQSKGGNFRSNVLVATKLSKSFTNVLVLFAPVVVSNIVILVRPGHLAQFGIPKS
jgi:hypothetical protein